MRFKTIRQTAAYGLLPEHRLRTMQKNGELPGFWTGNRFMVDVDALKDQLALKCESQSSEEVSINEQSED